MIQLSPHAKLTQQPENNQSQANSDSKNLISSFVSRAIVILGVVYLLLIPSGRIKNKFELVDVGILLALLVANSDVIQRVSQLKIGKDGVEFSVDQIKAEVKEDVQKHIEDQERKASEVLKLVDLLLSETTLSGVSVEDIKKQISNISPVIAEYIYYRAKEVRRAAWLCKRKGEAKPGLMERTIPIFEALIESKYGDKRHRFYAQLGYALKDIDSPRWKAAERNLDKAIELWQEDNQNDPEAILPPYYCFNWLLCVVKLEGNYWQQLESDTQAKMPARVKAVASCKNLWQELEKEPAFQAWLKREQLENAFAALEKGCRNEKGDNHAFV